MKSRKPLYCASPSSSSEDEGEQNRALPTNLTGIHCKNSRCDQELVCVNKSDYYCSRDCYFAKVEGDQVGETGIQLKRITAINGRGGTGLLRDRSLLDHLVIKLDNVLGRIVTVHNAGIEAYRWKKEFGKGKISTQNKAVDEAKLKRNEEEKRRLKELLGATGDSSSEESTDSDNDTNNAKEDNDEEESAHEEILTTLSSGINSSICPVHPAVGRQGTRLKGYIINIVSPWELYIQTESMVIGTNDINEMCNRPQGIDPRLIIPNWLPEVGEYCAAKYEAQFYRAKILQRLDNSFQVKYIDYGNIGIVSQTDVCQLNPEVTLLPRQYFFFKVSNVKPFHGTKWDTKVCEFTMEHLDGGVAELEIESVERGVVHWGKLNVLSSLSKEIKGDFGNILVERKLANHDSFYL